MKKLTHTEHLPINKLKPFEGHPFYVKDDDDSPVLHTTQRVRVGIDKDDCIWLDLWWVFLQSNSAIWLSAHLCPLSFQTVQ